MDGKTLEKVCFILAALSFAAGTCCAQSFVEKEQKSLSFHEESAAPFARSAVNTTMPVMPQVQGLMTMPAGGLTPILETEFYYKNDFTNSHNSSENELWEVGNLGLSAVSSEDTYINLLKSRSAAFMLNYRNGNFSIKAGLVANQYATLGTTTQLGINGILEYKISPHWSLAAFGTIYNSNPYFSMATFPFVATSSYGGWIKYEGGKMGVKLGARRYYDAFQRQWKTEPIVTPSVKIGKKMVFELPVGPLVQEAMEKLLRKGTPNGPIIMPNCY